mgnify:CR=1 FL=1
MEEESLKRNITSDSNNSLPRRVFICVYRHIEPSKKQWNELISAAQKTPSLQEFSNTYIIMIGEMIHLFLQQKNI